MSAGIRVQYLERRGKRKKEDEKWKGIELGENFFLSIRVKCEFIGSSIERQLYRDVTFIEDQKPNPKQKTNKQNKKRKQTNEKQETKNKN